MPKPITIKGEVSDGGAPSDNLTRGIANALRLWAGSGVELTFKNRTRSLSANSYYWGVVVDAVTNWFRDLGYACQPQEVHQALKEKFLPPIVTELPDFDHLDVVREVTTHGTTRTDSLTFWNYVDAIRDHPPFVAAGLYVPEPGEPREKLRGRTIHEPGGTKVTFAAESAHDRQPAASPKPVPNMSEFFEPTGRGIGP